MKRIIAVLSIAATLTSLLNGAISVPLLAEAGSSISGHVYQADNTTPIAGATVYAVPIEGGNITQTTTAADGSYTIGVLPAGNYWAYADAGGYIREYYASTHVYYQATPVSVTAPDETTDINFSLDVGGRISGYVFQADNTTPIAGATVYIITPPHPAPAPKPGEPPSPPPPPPPPAPTTITAPDGSYMLSPLCSGNYEVGAYAEGYVREFYAETCDPDQATSVPVTAPDETTAINFNLDVSGGISGHVYQADNTTPIAGVSVMAYLVGSGYSRGAGTASDGSYTISGIPSGNYWVRAWAYRSAYLMEYYGGTDNYQESIPVPVTAPDVTSSINFNLKPGGTISGHVYQSDNSTPIAGAYVQAIPLGPAPSSPGRWPESVPIPDAITGSDGSYTITGLRSGSYRVSAQVSAYAEGFKEYYNGTAEYGQATPVSVTVPYNTPGINFSLESGGSISGYVYGSDNLTPLANLRVAAMDYMTRKWIAGANTDSSGSYTIPGLPDGNYLVEACPSCSAQYLHYAHDTWYSGAPLGLGATPVPVTAPGNTPGINFCLELLGSISGYVYQSDNTTPISGAKIRVLEYAILDYQWVNISNSATTDGEGHYVYDGLPPGSYGVWVSATGFASEWYEDTKFKEEAMPVLVTILNTTPNINFALEPGGTISGHVYEADNITPIRKAQVWVYGSNNLTCGVAFTNAAFLEGSYKTSGLLTGQYLVQAQATGYATEWYNGVYEPGEATPVTVSAPNETTTIDFSLEGGKLVTIKLVPSTDSVVISSNFTVDILVETGDQPINGVDAVINYDPADMIVTGITPDKSTLPIELYRQWNNTTGELIYAAGAPLGGYYATGTFTIATITFQCQQESDNATISFITGKNQTQIAYDEYDVLGAAIGCTVKQVYDTPLRLNPATEIVAEGQQFTLALQVNCADNQSISGAKAYVSFNATYLEVVSITPVTTSLDTELLGTTWDNVTGTLQYAASKAAPPYPAGTFTIANVTFRARQQVIDTRITFSTSGNRTSEVTYSGSRVYGVHTDATIQIVELGVMTVTIKLQGDERTAQQLIVPFKVNLFAENVTLTWQNVLTALPISSFTTSDWAGGSGGVTITHIDAGLAKQVTLSATGMLPGRYNISLTGPHNLVNLRNGVEITAGGVLVNMGTLPEGNADDSYKIDIGDFGILAVSYRARPTDGNWDARADFNRSLQVTIADFSLLAMNFNKTSPVVVTG